MAGRRLVTMVFKHLAPWRILSYAFYCLYVHILEVCRRQKFNCYNYIPCVGTSIHTWRKLVYVLMSIKNGTVEFLSMRVFFNNSNCSDRSMDVELPILLGKYDRTNRPTTDQPTNAPTKRLTDRLIGSYTFPIRQCLFY